MNLAINTVLPVVVKAMPAIVECKHGSYNLAVSSNRWKHKVQVLCPSAEYVPAPHAKQFPEIVAPVIKQH